MQVNPGRKKERIIIREEYCMGCRLCEIYCLVQHSHTKNILKVYKGEYPRPLPRIRVEEKGVVSFAIQCRHCEEPSCLDACPTGAIYRDEETGAVLCDEDKCAGCWMCIMLCPLGVIRMERRKKKVASKCDLCIGEEFPVCVKNCPNEALIYEK